MGIFDGVLIASDWDGTLFDGSGVPKKNIEAIKHFEAEGGIFTIASGRTPFYIRSRADLVSVNTYSIGLNGAVIFDHRTGEIISDGVIDGVALDILEDMLSSGVAFKEIYFSVRGENEFVTVNIKDYEKIKSDIISRGVHDIVMIAADKEAGCAAMDFAKTLPDRGYTVARSYDVGVEILKNELTKGAALRKIAGLTDSHLTVAVGDYENDIPMLRDADIGYAVAGAIDSLRAVADRTTVKVTEGAIAKVISDLEKELSRRK